MDEDHHHGPLEKHQNFAGDRCGLGNPVALQTVRQMAFRCCFMLSSHPSRRMARQVRELDGKPGKTRGAPINLSRSLS